MTIDFRDNTKFTFIIFRFKQLVSISEVYSINNKLLDDIQ